ncbi:bifunctional 3-deoxy-7-phosphoheptulonate synthase/chorismate mutase type II [Blattabacterium cuenoti]|uniref:bifunctional 3-deoxy-7-phosphoheptulonate synthase/chorismate mutase type II n=1 Tax=Blattabacterium cuenoti TaxID=1653831 RepID=UPI00163BDE5A|nr:bifunctional 3-deoxy-7-phosphoheptulonate synthase/chorismate mutase type II [Blattabacterium cuenoti]
MGILNDKIDRSWIDKFDKPFIISGPCSAESEKQILDTAYELDKSYVQVFRAGIWKPRTKPGNFEGIGKNGLKWLNKVQKYTRLMVATEVANAEHVNLCKSHGIDILWIGARSTTSPFIVQEIADALEGDDQIIVLVKNPIHPDIELWLGAIERLYKKGIRKLGLIHRGFFTYKSIKYRNQPNWKLILDIKNYIPRIPILCDPSHICGNKDRIFDVAKKSLNYFSCDGLMIESHCDPNQAWSDSKQQITPKVLLKLLEEIFIKQKQSELKYKKNLYSLRILIDELDENLISILSERMNISKKLGILKNTSDVDILQPNRWKSVMEQSINLGKNLGLSEDFLERIFNLLHKESIKIQNKINE